MPTRDPGGEFGPGIIETTIVFGLSAALAGLILLAFGGLLADVIGLLADAAHGGT